MSVEGQRQVRNDLWPALLCHRERLQRLVRRRLGHTDEVDDCVQEVLIRAATFADLDESRLGKLLTSIALRLCVDNYRSRVRQWQLVSRSVVEHAIGPEEAVCEQAMGSWLLRQVGELSQREQEVIMARAQGMTTAQAAVSLGISHKSAESAYTRARARLRARHDHAMAAAELDGWEAA
jgi:RNA polymerase sigma-70 factor (ECF subfamily)